MGSPNSPCVLQAGADNKSAADEGVTAGDPAPVRCVAFLEGTEEVPENLRVGGVKRALRKCLKPCGWGLTKGTEEVLNTCGWEGGGGGG